MKPPHSVTMSLISVFSSIPSFHPPHPWRWIQSPGSYGFSACSNPVLSCLAVFYSRLGQVAVANSSCRCGGRASPARGPAFWQDVLHPSVAGADATAPFWHVIRGTSTIDLCRECKLMGFCPWAHDRSCSQQSSGTSFHVVGRGSEALHSPRLQWTQSSAPRLPVGHRIWSGSS